MYFVELDGLDGVETPCHQSVVCLSREDVTLETRGGEAMAMCGGGRVGNEGNGLHLCIIQFFAIHFMCWAWNRRGVRTATEALRHRQDHYQLEAY